MNAFITLIEMGVSLNEQTECLSTCAMLSDEYTKNINNC